MLAACKKYGTHVIMSSDAHVDIDVGSHELSIEVLKENDFPEELVVNVDPKRFYAHLKKNLSRRGVKPLWGSKPSKVS